MLNRITGSIAAAIALTLLYCITVAAFTPWDIAIGAAISTGALVAARAPSLATKRRVPLLASRMFWFVPYFSIVAIDILRGSWRVALLILSLRPARDPGLIAIPFGTRSELGIAVSAIATSLAPGTLLVEIDHERREMILHVVDGDDPEAVRRNHQRIYDRWQRRVFP